MKYLFSGFLLDTEKKELYYKKEVVYLTKHKYQLLLYFIQNSKTIIDKELLIEHVWNGRIVADNSIDQSIYKIKKQLNDIYQDKYFETVYGHGVKFLPDVSVKVTNENCIDNVTNSNFSKTIILFVTIAIIISLFFLVNKKEQLKTHHINDDFISILVIPPGIDKQNKSWLQDSSNLMFEQIFSTSKNVILKDYKDKPSNLTQQQFIETQWKIAPELKVLTTDIAFKDSLFTVTINSIDKQGNEQNREFYSQDLNSALTMAVNWFSKYVDKDGIIDSSNQLIPKNSNLLELYIRGLSAFANNNVKKAINYFELCLDEEPRYIPAILELAKSHHIKGDKPKALALLNSAKYIDKDFTFEVQIEYAIGRILFQQGKVLEVEKNYLNLLNKYKEKKSGELSLIKMNLAEVYKFQSKNKEAIDILHGVEMYFKLTHNTENLAKVLQRKGSLLLKMNKVVASRKTIEEALNISTKLGDLYGVAANTAITARIDSREGKYDSAIEHLQHALNVMKKIDSKHGVAATLNEIIALLITQGKIDQAKKLNIELEKIAIDIDFTALLLASKLFNVMIAEINKKWVSAEIFLKEHLELAMATNNKYAITHNKLKEISILINQNKTENILAKTQIVQDLIDKNKSVNWQPFLDLNTAKYYFATDQFQKAISLLIATKQSLLENQNTHYIIELNNLLASHYLKINQPKKVLSILEENNISNSIPYPTLLYKSKANFALGNIPKAIEQASHCKSLSHDLWMADDEVYLSKIRGQD